jgi:ketosteroid isomerase-like protein
MSEDYAALAARIQKLEDIEAIRNLRMEYHRCVNEGDLSVVDQIYTEDAHVEFEGVGKAKGRKEGGALVAHLASGLSFIKQFITNHIVHVNGDEAEGVSYLDARYVFGGEAVIASCKYVEKYRRTSEGWRISYMNAVTYFTVPFDKGWANPEGPKIKVPLPEFAEPA